MKGTSKDHRVNAGCTGPARGQVSLPKQRQLVKERKEKGKDPSARGVWSGVCGKSARRARPRRHDPGSRLWRPHACPAEAHTREPGVWGWACAGWGVVRAGAPRVASSRRSENFLAHPEPCHPREAGTGVPEGGAARGGGWGTGAAGWAGRGDLAALTVWPDGPGAHGSPAAGAGRRPNLAWRTPGGGRSGGARGWSWVGGGGPGRASRRTVPAARRAGCVPGAVAAPGSGSRPARRGRGLRAPRAPHQPSTPRRLITFASGPLGGASCASPPLGALAERGGFLPLTSSSEMQKIGDFDR